MCQTIDFELALFSIVDNQETVKAGNIRRKTSSSINYRAQHMLQNSITLSEEYGNIDIYYSTAEKYHLVSCKNP